MTRVPIVVVHGGAGDVASSELDARQAACVRAAERGLRCLERGGSALDAVVEAVVSLEDDPLFNAGYGACLTEDGSIELDASIMNGTDLQVGAVGALPPYANPIRIAHQVLRDGRHAFYAGEGADMVARRLGFVPVAVADLATPRARERLADAKVSANVTPPSGVSGGTVGAVVCDGSGSVAAATSTGGMTNKRRGRVGDSAVIGAGTYADDHLGAASATGHGEAIIRVGLARVACDALRTTEPAHATTQAIETLADRVRGAGGIILVDRHGRWGVAKNTRRMPYAVAIRGTAAFAGA